MEGLLPPRAIVYYMLDRERYPNDRWLTVPGIILFGKDSIEMEKVLCTDQELQDMMEAMEFLALEAYRRTQKDGKRMRHGEPSTRHPGMGVYIHSLGPRSPIPGERLQIVIYDETDTVVRRFEQVKGRCIDEGYVDFFGFNNRPARYESMPLVDIDAEGNQTVLVEDFRAGDNPQIYYTALANWVGQYGVPQPDREEQAG